MDIGKKLLVLPSVENIEEIIGLISDDVLLTKGHYYNLTFTIKDNIATIKYLDSDVSSFSTVWLSSFWQSRDLAYGVKLYLDHFDVNHTYVEKATSKITDQLIFSFQNISTPNMYFINKGNVKKYLVDIEEICGYPLIIKDSKGSRGKYSVLVKNRKELINKIRKLPKHRKYIFQQFIENDYDWGVLVANGSVVSAEKSYSKDGEYRNNTCNGAKEVFVNVDDIPQNVKDIAINASHSLGLSWSRSDIVIDRDTEDAYLLEVNRSPGISSGTSEVFGAKQFLESIM